MKKNTYRTKILAIVLTLVMLLGALPPTAVADYTPNDSFASLFEDNITVFVSFEGFTIGQGFFIPPTAVTVPAGSSIYTATTTLLRDHSTDYIITMGNNFLDNVQFAWSNPVIPQFILDTGRTFVTPENNGWLGSMDFSSESGWMYSVNHVGSDYGLSDIIANDGDVLRWQFSIYSFGSDLGVRNTGGFPQTLLYYHADKTELIREVASRTANSTAKQAALQVIIDPLATVAQVADALATLQSDSGAQEPPEDFWFVVDSPMEPGTNPAANPQAFINIINRILEEEFNQSPGNFDYSVVTRLKVTGTIPAHFFNWGANIRNHLGPYLEKLDLSGVTSGTLANIQNWPALQHVIMPAGINISSGFGNNLSLETITWVGNVATFNPTNSLIASTFFSNTPAMRYLYFLGDTAPTFEFADAMFGTPRFIAYVVDDTSGGFELPAFRDRFIEVRTLCADALPPEADRTALGLIIEQAVALEQADFIPTTWAPFAQRLEAAQVTYTAQRATQADINTAANNLQNAITALIRIGDDVTFINVPAGTTIGVFRKPTNHFAPFTAIEMTIDAELSVDGRDVYRARVPLGVDVHLEAFTLGETVKHVRVFRQPSYGGTIVANPTPLSEWNFSNSQAWQDNNVLTNLPDSGTLNLAQGEVFYLDTFRVWQAMSGTAENYFIEPNYTFIPLGSSAAIERVGLPGREQLRITGAAPGTSVIKVTYEPIEYIPRSGSTLRFGGIDPSNTLAVVVNVGTDADFDTGITIRNDFDTIYFTNTAGYGEFTFTPSAGSIVRVHDPLNVTAWGDGWSESTQNADGSFTVRLYDGRNIIEVRNGSSVRYHVIRARGINVTVENVTNPGQAFEVYDTVRIRMSGISEPVEKLAGLYNPGFTGGWGAPDGRPFIRIVNAEGTEFDSNRGNQFQTLSTTFTVEFVLTDVTQNVLGGQIHVGVMGDPVGTHRSIPLTGVSANMTAGTHGPFGFGALPEIVLPIRQEQDTSDKSALNALIILAEARVEITYTPASWTAFAQALANAVAVRNNLAATQNTVDTAVSTLQAAMTNLVVYIPAITDPIEQTLRSALDWIYSYVSRSDGPQISVSGGEWAMLAMARSGRIHLTDWSYSYQNILIAAASQRATASQTGAPTPVILNNNLPTENQRVIIALTSLGIDASNFNGFDFVAPLLNTAWATSQGNNSTAFTLVSFDTIGYFEGQSDDTRLVLINDLISPQNQNADGSWGIQRRWASDRSMTAMVIQALAPYYGTNANVRASVDRALTWMSAQQNANGSFGTNSQDNAQAIVALTALGIDPAEDSRFIKNGNTLIDALMTFRITSGNNAGAFGNTGATIATAISTEQAAYALASVYRLRTGQTKLYDMRDMFTNDGTPILVDRSALNEAIANTPTSQGSFTAATWTALIQARMTAAAVRDNPYATQAQINTATSALNAAIAALTVDGGGGQPGGPSGTLPQHPTTITVTFSLFGAPRHNGEPAYIWRTNRSAFEPWITSRTLTFNTHDVTVYDVFTQAIREAGLEARITNRGNYVSAVRGPNGWLGEFDNGPNSGWMYMVNGVHVSLGLGEQILRNGDVILWHFTDDFTQEAGGQNWGPPPGGGTGGIVPPVVPATPPSLAVTLPEFEIPLDDIYDWESLFVDVHPDNWFYEAVRFVNISGLMHGTSDVVFSPNTTLTRAMLITILARTAGVDTTVGDSWYSEAIVWALESGISDGTNLHQNITREQLVTMIFRFAGLLEVPTDGRSELYAFSDAEDVSYWASDAKAWAIYAGLIRGRTETTLAPIGTATRAETATILMRFLGGINNA